MENKLIQHIIKEKMPCYFVSPHFDDAVLSAGDLIVYLSTKTKVTVINVFTKAGDLNTLSAKKFVKDSGFDNAKKLFKARDREDKEALLGLPVNRINLNFRDALWRIHTTSKLRRLLAGFMPEFNAIYPTYRFNIQKGKISKEDNKTIEKVAAKLKNKIRSKKAVIFCPIGIGNHVDHLITKAACKLLGRTLILWTDFPYIQRNKVAYTPSARKYFSFKKNITLKTRMINSYKTQVKGLFPGGKFNTVTEKYYTLNNK